MTSKEKIVFNLFDVINERINNKSNDSYVNNLHKAGINRIAEKIGEEAVETIVAILSKEKKEIIYESADLIFMLLIAWAEKGIHPNEIFDELIRREGISGIKEKENRWLQKNQNVYDKENIFAKILRGERPCTKVYEDEFSLAFNDINPQSQIHILVIPKGEYISFDDFSGKASSKEIISFFKSISEVAKQVGVDRSGYRIISNHGLDSHQEVPHFHVHILGGNPLGSLLVKGGK